MMSSQLGWKGVTKNNDFQGTTAGVTNGGKGARKFKSIQHHLWMAKYFFQGKIDLNYGR